MTALHMGLVVAVFGGLFLRTLNEEGRREPAGGLVSVLFIAACVLVVARST